MRLKIEPSALEILAESPPPVRECLRRALDQLRDGSLRLIDAGWRPGLFYAFACDHTITVAQSHDGEILFVLGLLFDPGAEIP